MTLCCVTREADASTVGCVSSGDLTMSKPRAEFRWKTMVFLSMTTVAEIKAEGMMFPISVMQSGGILVWIHQIWPWSTSPEPRTFLCSHVVNEEQTCSAFGWDGKSGSPRKWNKYPVLLLQLPSTQTLRGHLLFSTQKNAPKDFLHISAFLLPAGNAGCVPLQAQHSPPWLPARQCCPPSSSSSPFHPSTPKRTQACQATSTSQQDAHGLHQKCCLPG